jgi:hypothetical protein
LIARIPWSVQLSKHMNIGMRSSLWSTRGPSCPHYQPPLVLAKAGQ